MISIIVLSGAAGVFIVCLAIEVILLVKSVPAYQKEEMKQFDENQKTFRWNAAYKTAIWSLPLRFVLFIVSLLIHTPENCAPYFLAADIIFSVTVFLCICIWKDLFYILSNMTKLNTKLFKFVLIFFICLELAASIAGICVSHSTVYIYFIMIVLSVLAIYITYSGRLKSDEGSLTIDNSDFAR